MFYPNLQHPTPIFLPNGPFTDDLMSQNPFDRRENIYKEKGSAVQYLNNLARSVLTEVSYQYLPPSGLPVSIPRMVHVRNWYKRG